ncbi:C-C motif chemokine 4 [Protobothrops mucrosquamatus]|uniref:C-C motif chemokine 4 n=1 Tax=Protobothrops mucrosquamatus TaxID=103944 RepID=UPI000775E79C|nr:C-C motif chemokine 4 [Protobothrops mucrosquamatus]
MRASAQTAGSLALLLVLVLMLGSSILATDPPTSCCFSYTKKRIPRTHVIDFYETNSRCSQPAVVFISRKKLQICANPLEKWVQDHMNYLKVNRTVHATVAN